MINTNVGDMPLDIFTDYLNDTLDQEWSWEYLITAINDAGHSVGVGYGVGGGYGHWSGLGNGMGFGDGHGYGWGNEPTNAFGTHTPKQGHGKNHKGNG
jgi:hypothetical protein